MLATNQNAAGAFVLIRLLKSTDPKLQGLRHNSTWWIVTTVLSHPIRQNLQSFVNYTKFAQWTMHHEGIDIHVDAHAVWTIVVQGLNNQKSRHHIPLPPVEKF